MMTVLGVVLVIFSAVIVIMHGSALDAWLTVAFGVLLMIIGLALLITEHFEAWLSGGQTALVDGLQAG
jgi:TctA family transporter